jgi:peptidoglycan hydrolase FlgJ
MSRSDFVLAAYSAAVEAVKAGAKINPIIAAAQAALESAYGASRLAKEANNLFGIKAGKSWKGAITGRRTREFDPDRGWYEIVADFRSYPTLRDCFKDYGEIIGRLSWYQDAARSCKDPGLFLRGIEKTASEPGWATDPDYAKKVWNIAKQFGLIPSDAVLPPRKK